MGCCSDWPGKRPASGWCYIGSDRRCLGRLACREIGRLPEGSSAPSGTAANVGSDGPAVPGKSRAGEEGGTPTGTAANVGSDGPAVPGRGVRDERNVTGIRRSLFFGYNVPAPVHYMTGTLYDRYII